MGRTLLSPPPSTATGPLVSVVVPTYNRADVIAEAVDSALNQTYAPLEVVVVDDGSTDDTPAVMARFVERYGEHRVRYVRQPNAGPATARNTGVAHARGDLIALLDSDDRWVPDKLALQVPLIDTAPGGHVGLVYGAFRCFGDGDGASRPAPTTGQGNGDGGRGADAGYYAGDGLGFHDLLAFVALGTQTLLFRRDVFDAVGGFDEACSPAEDQDFTIRVAARYALRGLDRPVAEIRLHPNQISGDKSRMFRASMHVLRKNRRAHPGACPQCRVAAATASRKIHGFYYRDLNRRARAAAGAGRVLRAAALSLKAFWVDPTALARVSGRLLGRAQRS